MDYTTLANVKTYMQTLSTADDTLISGLITAYSDQIDNYCNMDLGQATVTNLQLRNVSVDRDGFLWCYPPTPVITTLTAASYRVAGRFNRADVGNATYQNFTPLDVTQAEIYPAESGAQIGFYGVSFVPYRSSRVTIQVSYTGGYASNALPPDLEMACRRLVKWGYEKRVSSDDKAAYPDLGMVVVPGNWPSDVKQVLNNYRKVVAS